MANLSNKEVANRPDKPESAITFISKILKLEGHGSDFKTDDGLFCADSVAVTYKDGSSQIYKRSTKKALNIQLAKEYIERGPLVKSINITGKLFGSKSTKVLGVIKFIKTAEFGGQPSGGKKINRGIKFENDFFARLNHGLEGKQLINENNNGIGSYATAVSYILRETSLMKKSPADSVEDTGGRNTSRPIRASEGSLYIAPNDHTQHGALLSDIDVHHISGQTSHLSLKYGATLTFMNAGVGKTLTEKEMKTGAITNIQGKNILAAFGIDEAMFCDVFNEYGNKKFPSIKTTLNTNQRSLCRNLLSTGVGSGYWMVHGQPDNSVHFYYMSAAKNKTASSPPTEVLINYGGSRGNGKRVDVQFSNTYFDFKLNIRNKQRGLYPSHIMLDYTTKPAIGKIPITNSTNITNL